MFVRFKPDPHNCYVVSFATALAIYLLGWSGLYPTLHPALIAFLISTCIIHLWLSRRLRIQVAITASTSEPAEKSPVYVTLFIYFLWIMEFVYEGGVPLIKILLDIPYDYRMFGIPSVHVFVVTFSSFYTVYLFQLYLAQRTRMLLLLFVVNLLAALLIYSRAMLFFNMTACLMLYLTYKGGFDLRKIAVATIVAIVLLFVFGALGSLRVSRIAGQPYNNENFMNTGQATDAFRNSFLPKEYFWAYIYISSPLANFQQNINLFQREPVTLRKFAELVNAEIFPDFISKRTRRILGLTEPIDSRIPGPFNVSTIYSRAFCYAGWMGSALIAAFLIFFPLLFTRLLPPSSRFFLPGWTILCTMYFFSVYDNTFRFTGLSFQLVYPVLLHWTTRKYQRLTRVF